MSRTMPSINDVVSLTVMILMIVALVASQANATDYRAAVSEIAHAPAYEEAPLPLTARAQAEFRTASATIVIDVSAEIRRLLLDGK